MDKEEKLIKKTAEDLLKSLAIDGDVLIENKEDIINIELSTEDSGIVIGRHGDVLESLQTILALCISDKLGKFKRVSLEVGDYKKKREEYLMNILTETKDIALRENREVTIPALKAWERRVIHVSLKDDKEVSSESIGEGKDRALIIRPKN